MHTKNDGLSAVSLQSQRWIVTLSSTQKT